MGCGVTCVDNVLTRSFYRLGVQIGHTPGYFLIVPILLTLLCITGYQQIHYQMDPEYLFSPEKGPGKTERAIVETYFKMNYTSRFNPTRITRPGQWTFSVGLSLDSTINSMKSTAAVSTETPAKHRQIN